MKYEGLLAAALACGALCAHAEPQSSDPAVAFGARPSVTDLQLSPDGTSVSFVGPIEGQGSVVYTLSLAPGSKVKAILRADGKPLRLRGCSWASNQRLICNLYALVPDPTLRVGLVPLTRVVAVNADGSKLQLLSTKVSEYSRGYLQRGGEVIDWLPDQEGAAVLMTRQYLPDSHSGSHIGSDAQGLGVDWIDTQTLSIKHVIPARPDAVNYITDGRGTVRILAYETKGGTGSVTGVETFMYRLRDSDTWRRLSEYNTVDRSGFRPLAVDHDLNVAYGFKKTEGRMALYSMSLDESLKETLVYAHPDVDLSGLIRIGRRRRVVGVSYSTDIAHAEFFDPLVQRLIGSLAKALPEQPLLRVVDSSVDESKMIVFAGSDSDPGTYYVFDRNSHELHPFIAVRGELDGMKLAHVKPMSYPAADGTLIPAYLTLPPGAESAHGLPAIVLPHGGPGARDEWGFDWLSQFYAARGFAVLQPQFRGSAGYGDAWFQKNGFQSWQIAIGDVLDAGRWLVREGIADPAKLGIVGWSYGGYAALQSGIVDPKLFKAIVAIAPVTDLSAYKQEHLHFTDAALVSEFVGSGPHMHEGSPIEHAKALQVPVLLFHGTNDRNVSVEESKSMQAALLAATVRSDLIVYPDRDHYLEDSEVRADMLRKSDAFLRKAFGM
jgi:dienelactone hydrolase